MTSIMTTGLRLNFNSFPPLTSTPDERRAVKGKNLELIRPFISDFIKRGIVREVETPQELFISSVFTAPKKDGRVRPIIDLKNLNQFLNVPKFKMETVARVSKCILENSWGVIIDLKDAFFLIPLAWSFHKYFTFTIDNKILVFQFMPSGLSLAPGAFTRVMRPVMREIHKKGITNFCLLDEFLIIALSAEGLIQKSKEILKLFQKLGIQVNWKKSILIPAQCLEYLRVICKFRKMTLSIPENKISSILTEIDSINQKAFCTTRKLESLIGLLNFAAS